MERETGCGYTAAWKEDTDGLGWKMVFGSSKADPQNQAVEVNWQESMRESQDSGPDSKVTDTTLQRPLIPSQWSLQSECH